jgi:acetyltransferase-like isoleucine patch superfamily enzyme
MNYKIKLILKTLRSLPYSIYFNFHYLPLKQAIRLPILLYKPCLLKTQGEIKIETPQVKVGMIRLGLDIVSLYYPNNRCGIIIDNNGGTIVFKGKGRIGSGSAISIGPHGRLELGDNFSVSANFKIVSYNKILIGANFSGAWEVIIMDTDFHQTVTLENGKRSQINGEIRIGNNNWFGIRTLILKRTQTPDYCIVLATTVLNKKVEYDPYCMIGGNPVELKKNGIYRDYKSYEE